MGKCKCTIKIKTKKDKCCKKVKKVKCCPEVYEPCIPLQDFSATLSGAQEVPAVSTPATGVGHLQLDEFNNVVHYKIAVQNLTTPIQAAHLHQAPAGQNGPVIVTLAPFVNGVSTGHASLTAAQVAALKRAGVYINVHTALHPDGEVRGQVFPLLF